MKNRSQFKLSEKVDAYIISLHVRNLMATYGEQEVREIIKVLFLEDQKTKKQKKGGLEWTHIVQKTK